MSKSNWESTCILSLVTLLSFLSVAGYLKQKRLEREQQANKRPEIISVVQQTQQAPVLTLKENQVPVPEVSSKPQLQHPKASEQKPISQVQQAQPKQPTLPPPLSQDAIRQMLKMGYKPFCAIGEQKRLNFYRCSAGKVTVGYGCNVQIDPSRLNGIDIFRQFSYKEISDLSKKIVTAKTAQEITLLLKDMSIDGTQQSLEAFLRQLHKVSSSDVATLLKDAKLKQKILEILSADKKLKQKPKTDNDLRSLLGNPQIKQKILNAMLKDVVIKRKLSQKERSEFLSKMAGMPKATLETYRITEQAATSMYESIFNKTIPEVTKFLSNEKGETFFYDLPFQWQLVCMDIAYQRGYNGFSKFSKLKTALKAKNYEEAAKEIGTKDPRRLGIRKVILKQGEIVFNHCLARQKNKQNNVAEPKKPDYITQIKKSKIMDTIEINNMAYALNDMWNRMNNVNGLVSQKQLNEFQNAQTQAETASLKGTIQQNQVPQAGSSQKQVPSIGQKTANR